jgi:ABC-type multidrug transport system ATPase subunit
MSRLVADSITCRLGPRFALTDIFLDLATSEIVGLVGRNGCGKTTLLRALFGLAEVASGTVKVDGQYVAPGRRWRHIGYLPQQSFLPRDQNVRHAARMFLGPRGNAVLGQDPRLRDLARRKVGTLSAGERRYLEFHLVLGLNRPFALLDEPFSQIEPLYVELMAGTMRTRSPMTAFVLTDHNHWPVRRICTRLLSLDDGALRGIGSMDSDLQRAGYLPGG